MNKIYTLFSVATLTVQLASAQWNTPDSLSNTRTRFAAASSGNTAVFIGGQFVNFEADIYNAATKTWTKNKFPLDSNERRLIAGTVTNNLMFFGGGRNNAQGAFNSVHIYDVTKATWDTARLGTARSELTAAATGSTVLFAGGVDDNFTALKAVDIYNTITKSWKKDSLSAARNGACAIGIGSKILIAGGNTTLGITSNIVDIYDTLTGVWSTSKLSVGREFPVAISVGSKVMIAGGLQIDSTYNQTKSKVIDIYDVVTNTWTVDSMPTPRTHFCAGVVNGKIIFAGGETNESFKKVDIYDIATKTWKIDSLTTGRSYASSVVVGDKFMIAGGYDDAYNTLSSVEIYEVLYTGLHKVSTSNTTFDIIPNPSHSNTVIKLNQAIEKGNLQILNSVGELVYSQTINSNLKEINLTGMNFANGIYFVKLYSDDASITKKLVIN